MQKCFPSRLLITHVCFPFFRICCRERDCRARNKNGQWKTQESPQTAHNLLQFPAGGFAEALSEHSVPRAAGESRTGRVSGAHTDTGMCSLDSEVPIFPILLKYENSLNVKQSYCFLLYW